MSTIWAFDNVENKDRLYREGDCMKNFLYFLKKICDKCN